MQGVLIGFTCLYLLSLGPSVVAGIPVVLRHRRQDDGVSTAEITTASSTTLSFEELLENMFKDLGMDTNETETTSNLDSSTQSYSSTTAPPDASFLGTQVFGETGETLEPVSVTPPVAMVSGSTPVGSTDTSTYNPENGVTLSTAIPENLTTLPTSTEAPISTTQYYTSASTETVLKTTQIGQDCYVTPVLRDFCILPDDLTAILGESVTLHDISDFVLSMDIVDELMDKCPAGSWCLNSKHSFDHLEEKVAFWSNSSDFLNLCWSPLDSCLRSVVDYYTECDNFEMYLLIEDMNKLLCEMKEEPRASRDCIEQTMKALHVSMADFHRNKQDLEDSNDANICQRREARMTSNLLCATNVCGADYADLLYEFEPWGWFMDSVEMNEAVCVYEEDRCVTQREEAAEEREEEKEEEITEEKEEESEQNTEGIDRDKEEETEQNSEELGGELTDNSNEDDKSKEYQGVWVSEELDLPSAVIIGAISLGTLGFVVLLAAIWWVRKRRNNHRYRDGVEYMEILPDTDDF